MRFNLDPSKPGKEITFSRKASILDSIYFDDTALKQVSQKKNILE